MAESITVPKKVQRSLAPFLEPPIAAIKNKIGSDLADALINPESTEEQDAAVQIIGQVAGAGAGNKGGARQTRRHKLKKLRARRRSRRT